MGEPGEAAAPPPDGEGYGARQRPPVRAARAGPAREATTEGLRQYAEGVEAGRIKRKPPANADEIERAVLEAQEELKRAGERPPFSRDPYGLVLAALSVTLGVFPKVVRRTEGAVSTTAAELARLVEAVRHPFTEEERAAVKRDMVQATRDGARAGAEDIARCARAQDRRSLAAAFAGGMLALAAMGMGGFAVGRGSGRAEASAAAAALKTELEIGQQRVSMTPAQAAVWVRLWQANPDIAEAVRRAQNVTADAGGRRGGAVPLWLDPAGPPQQARK